VLIGIEINIEIECFSCNTKVPLKGLEDTCVCHNCLSPMSFLSILKKGQHEAWLRNLLLVEIAKSDWENRTPKKSTGTIIIGAIFKYQYYELKKTPCCHHCETEFTEDQIRASKTQIDCKKCGEIIPVRRPSEAFKKWSDMDIISCVINDPSDLSNSSLEVNDQFKKAVIWPCLSCGVGLDLKGDTRTVTCQYCDSKSYVPYDVWIRLHPIPPTHPFTVIVNLEEQKDLLLKAKIYSLRSNYMDYDDSQNPFRCAGNFGEDSEVERLDADIKKRLKELTPEERIEIANLHHPEVNSILAAQPDMSTDLENILVSSKTEIVRIDVAKSLTLQPESMQTLSVDDRKDVRRSLAANKSLTEEAMLTLANDKEYGVKRELADNPNLSTETLKKLKKDDDEGIRSAAFENPNNSGLFSKLFGG